MAHLTLTDSVRHEAAPKQKPTQNRTVKNMPLVTIVIPLIVVGVLLWLVNTYIPMDGKIKKILSITVVVVVVLWLLNVFGVWGHLHDIRASNQSPSLGMSTGSMISQPGLPGSPVWS
jgi:hypothetical protein